MPAASAALITQQDLSVLQGEPRVSDIALARALGFARPRKIRELITRHKDELETYGPVVTKNIGAPHLGAPAPRGAEYLERRFVKATLLTEHQALLIGAFADAPNAATVRRALIETFIAWRRGQLLAAQSPRAVARRNNRIRYWKLQFAFAAMTLDGLGVDIAAIDLKAAVAVGRMIEAPPPFPNHEN